MEQKQVLLSALSVGVGVGLGLGLATGRTRTFHKWTTSGSPVQSAECIELELRNRITDGKESNVTFDEFPYYLSEQTRLLLTSAAYVHLKQDRFIKHTRNLAPASRAILLSGPAEPYHQMLAKALANFFEAKLLLLDVTDFSLKLQSRHGGGATDSTLKSLSEAAMERMSGLLGSFSMLPTRHEQKTSELGSLWRQNSNIEPKARPPEAPSNLRRLKSCVSEADISRLASPAPIAPNQAPLKRSNSSCAFAYDEKLFVQSLYKVLVSISSTSPVVLYLRDVERHVFRSQKAYRLFGKMIRKISGPVLILGSRMVDISDQQNHEQIDKRLSALFPYNIDIKPPVDNAHLVSWKSQLEEDMKVIQFQDNRNHISEVLAANDMECDDLSSLCFGGIVLSDCIEEIVVSAVSHHLMNTTEPEYRGDRLVISSKSLAHALKIFKVGQLSTKDVPQMGFSVKPPTQERQDSTSRNAEAKCEVPLPARIPEDVKAQYVPKGDAPKKADVSKGGIRPLIPLKSELALYDEFEKRIRPDVIPAGEIGVTFADIGALDNVKEALQELVMLPLQRPDLFKGGLLKPCKGILLFGPPGTGKTMLAKALATEAGASFINVSMSTITSKWFGEDEKNVRALFTLAAKVSPTVIFIDEVDSMMGQRSRAGEHETMRKIKNEFMAHWDGLLTKSRERVLVLAATNRPFDLDEAIIRRFERRIMVGLPTAENREKILRTLLGKENLEDGFDFHELATMTEGYTGSDLKNLCATAAFRPLRELIKKEQQKEKAMKENREKNLGEKSELKQPYTSTKDDAESKERVAKTGVTLRSLSMEDMRQAKNQVSVSFASEGAGMNELIEWNELYGEGGSRKKQQLSYFL